MVPGPESGIQQVLVTAGFGKTEWRGEFYEFRYDCRVFSPRRCALIRLTFLALLLLVPPAFVHAAETAAPGDEPPLVSTDNPPTFEYPQRR